MFLLSGRCVVPKSWLQTLGVACLRQPPQLLSVLWPGRACAIQGFSPSVLIMASCKRPVVFFVSKSGLFLCFSHLHPNLTSNFPPPVSGPGSSVPKSLHLPSVSHSILRIRRWEGAQTQGQPAKQPALCGPGVLGAVGVWGNAVSRFARKLGKL